jgi:hypothetical protein
MDFVIRNLFTAPHCLLVFPVNVLKHISNYATNKFYEILKIFFLNFFFSEVETPNPPTGEDCGDLCNDVRGNLATTLSIKPFSKVHCGPNVIGLLNN